MSYRDDPIEFAKVYAQRKALVMGLMDLQAFTSAAQELKLHLTDFSVEQTIFYYVYITIIVLAMTLQAVVGATLIVRRDLFIYENEKRTQNTLTANDWVTLATLFITMLNLIITA